MSEWWSYRPSDFLMFSARTWGRLLEGWNQALWPWQVPIVAAGVGLLLLAWRNPVRARVPSMLALAAAWAWVGWAFHWERFADINTGARWFAVAFGVQATLLVALGLRPSTPPPGGTLRLPGLALASLALLCPLLAPLTGRSWGQAETAGAMPDPTALFTVGLLLALPQRHRGLLLAIPLLALLVGWTTAWLLWVG
ncbi:hypothetical protein EZ313_06580 [Ramlibacter henchirensis]|uniref:MFS transporter permease n=1 Tax=Ramlibacter henchirensis TaxID=204072 RepID=A0A4Z0C3Z2_9BURK|nr:DUF6064 family protein [Ramlibacter henchirensis]TFZ06306.1 hypothetical protein EZ313_06580 [Ramlibacter henchirensis]